MSARESIEAAKSAYEHECELTKNAFDAGILGENGYKDQLEKLAQERDAKIEGALGCIDEVSKEYSAVMQEMGRLDGAKLTAAQCNGTVDFASRQDYYNYLAKDSLERMKTFVDENFDTVEQDFPVEYVQAKPTVW